VGRQFVEDLKPRGWLADLHLIDQVKMDRAGLKVISGFLGFCCA
jgi:hypothetical protein